MNKFVNLQEIINIILSYECVYCYGHVDYDRCAFCLTENMILLASKMHLNYERGL